MKQEPKITQNATVSIIIYTAIINYSKQNAS
jgi:hypothetical protein